MALADEVMKRYPTLSFLLRDPEVGRLLLDAVDPNKGFDASTFQAKLYQTRWWRTRSESMRQWEITAATDPGTANQRRYSYVQAVRQAAIRYGVKISDAEARWISEIGLQRGWNPAGMEIMTELAKMRLKDPRRAQAGDVDVAARQVQALAQREFLYPMSWSTAVKAGDQIARGISTVEATEAWLREKAAKYYPWAKEQLNQGFTINDLLDPARQTIAEELELDPDQINFRTGPYAAVINNKGIKPVDEVRKLVRQDRRWWKTSHGRQTDAQYAAGFLELMGKRRGIGGIAA